MRVETPVVPFRLHSHKVCADGSPAWSAQWEAWLSRAHITAHVQRRPRDWWENDYIYDRLVAHAESAQATFSLEQLNLALAHFRGELEETEHAPYWIKKAVTRVKRYASKYYSEPKAA